MSAVKSESHQKKKPTRHPKRKRAVGGDDDVHLINDSTHQDSILIAGENDVDNILTIVSPERGTNARPERLFDNASGSSSISPLVTCDVQACNTRFTKFNIDLLTGCMFPFLSNLKFWRNWMVRKNCRIIISICLPRLFRVSFSNCGFQTDW